MRHLDLFSGIGGFALAARWAGLETIGFAETDPYCSKVLSRHWPNVPNYGDVRNVGPVACDIITGGFPCQPFSVAGKRHGQADDRYLWPEMFSVISQNQPSWVVCENVTGIDGLALDDCISDMESIGYEVAPPLEIPACAVNAKHRRMRVWIVANLDCQRCERERVHVRSGQQDAATPEISRFVQVSSPDANGSGLSASGEPVATTGQANGQQVHVPAAAISWPDADADLLRMVHGVPNRVDRVKGLGNAIVPQVAYQIFCAIKQSETNTAIHAQPQRRR